VVNVDVEQQTFPAVEVRALLRKAQAVRNLTGDGPDGWVESNVDPAELVRCFAPWLRLKSGCSLLGYVYRSGGDGNGIVYAVPSGLQVPQISEGNRELYRPPQPPVGALPHVMDAIEPDGSLWSYLCCSMLARELAEFGACWHGEAWGWHRVIGGAPWLEPELDPEERAELEAESADDVPEQEDGSSNYYEQAHGDGPLTSRPDGWSTELPRPPAFDPVVRRGNIGVVVRFHTYCSYVQDRVICHTDFFEVGSLVAACKEVTLATGSGGGIP